MVAGVKSWRWGELNAHALCLMYPLNVQCLLELGFGLKMDGLVIEKGTKQGFKLLLASMFGGNKIEGKVSKPIENGLQTFSYRTCNM